MRADFTEYEQDRIGRAATFEDVTFGEIQSFARDWFGVGMAQTFEQRASAAITDPAEAAKHMADAERRIAGAWKGATR